MVPEVYVALIVVFTLTTVPALRRKAPEHETERPFSPQTSNSIRLDVLFSVSTLITTSMLIGTTLAVTQYMPVVGTEKLDIWFPVNPLQWMAPNSMSKCRRAEFEGDVMATVV